MLNPNRAVDILNLNTLEGPGWQDSEYVALSGYECWVEVKDMISLKYHPRIKPIKRFNSAGRTQTFFWSPDWTELLESKFEGLAGYEGEFRNFARATLGKEKPCSDLFDGAKDLQIVEAVWKSSQTQKPVKIEKL